MTSRASRKGTRFFLGACALSLLVGVAACGSDNKSSSPTTVGGGGDRKVGGTVKILTYSEMPSFLPEEHSANTPVHDLVYDTLIDIKDDDTIVPVMAKSLTEESDGTWTLVLRPGIKFSDGTPLNTEAIKSYWDMVSGDKANTCNLVLGALASSWKVVDDTTLSITPAASAKGSVFPRLLAGGLSGGTGTAGCASTIGSPTARAAEGADFAKKPVGAGPFLLKEWVPNDHMVFVKNPNYWQKGKPYLDEVDFKLIIDAQQRCDTFLAGGWQAIWVGTAQPCLGDLKSGGFKIIRSKQIGGIGPIFGLNRPPTDDKRVRQALAYAIDLNDLNDKAVNGQTQMVDYFIPKGDPNFVDVPSPVGNLAKGQKLLDEYLAEKGVTSVDLAFKVLGPIKNFSDPLLQQMSRLKGLNVKGELLDAGAITKSLLSKDFNVHVVSYSGPTPYYALNSLRTHSSAVSQYSNPQVDGWLDQLKDATDQGAKNDLLKQILGQVYDDMPGLPVWRSDRPTAIDANALVGYTLRPGTLFSVDWASLALKK
jgi:peptide/nickel transport system substrate-binding protein